MQVPKFFLKRLEKELRHLHLTVLQGQIQEKHRRRGVRDSSVMSCPPEPHPDKRAAQQAFRAALDEQVSEKRHARLRERQRVLELEQRGLAEAQLQLNAEQEQRSQDRAALRQALFRSWDEDVQARRLKRTLERARQFQEPLAEEAPLTERSALPQDRAQQLQRFEACYVKAQPVFHKTKDLHELIGGLDQAQRQITLKKNRLLNRLREKYPDYLLR